MEEEKKAEENTGKEETPGTQAQTFEQSDKADAKDDTKTDKPNAGDVEAQDRADGPQGVEADTKDSASREPAGANAEEEKLAAEWESALGEQAQEGEAAEFVELDKEKGKSTTPKDLEFILDIPLEVTVEMGRTKMLVNDLLQMGQGSIIELSRLAGEPFDILVNNKLIARGEVVVVNEKFGVRITDIVSPMERVKRLG